MRRQPRGRGVSFVYARAASKAPSAGTALISPRSNASRRSSASAAHSASIRLGGGDSKLAPAFRKGLGGRPPFFGAVTGLDPQGAGF